MPDPDGLTWIVLEDFTPGIITNSALTNVAINGTNTGPVPGNKSGQAQSAIGCIALPNGGLAPLPGLNTSPLPPTHAPASPTTTTTFINGLFVAGPFVGGFGQTLPYDDVVYGQESVVNATGAWRFYLEELQVVSNVVAVANTLESLGPTGSTVGLGLVTLTGDYTRANSTATDVGVPTLAIGYVWHDNGSDAYVWLFPNPTSPTSTTPYVLADTLTADVLTHQNRIVCLSLDSEDWTSTLMTFGNEQYNYTDPPNSLALGTQQEVFVQEHPFGHGTWGAISASELFLVKNSGGGYVIQGDLNAPTVTRLPGVTSTYGLMSRAASETPLGMVYASENRGLWSWAGGITSQKISNQLEDNSFQLSFPPIGVFHGPKVDIRGWGDWIVVSGDWLFDTNTGGWWKLPLSSTSQTHLFYGVSWDGNTLYASVPVPSSTVAIDMYDRFTLTNTFTWKSYPMRLSNGPSDRQYTVQEIVIRAQGSGTVTVTLEGVAGSSSATASSPSDSRTFTTTAQPSMQMIRTGLVAQDVTVTITSTGASTDAAPVVYSVALGVDIQNPVSAT